MTGLMMRNWLVMSVLMICASLQPALAQGQLTPVITVNDRVVTQYELTQRIRLLEVFGTPGDLEELARNALIEDRLKQQELARFDIALGDAALQEALEEFAGRADLTLPQFTTVLAQNGVDIGTLRDFVGLGILWRDYIRSRFSRSVTVTDADIERALARRGTATTQIEVLLSEIIIAAPPDRAARAREVADQIAQVRSFDAFEDAARQVSALPSRENGGRLGWVPLTNYPAPIRTVIRDLQRGEVTEPIEIPNGIALFQLRGLREAPRTVSPPQSISYAAYYIDGGRSGAALRHAAQIRDTVDTCDDLYGVARNQPVDVLDRVTLPPSQIADDIAIELARLDPGEVSYNLTRDNGDTLVFLMLCNRNRADSDTIDRDAIRNQIRSQRLSGLADALIADLRAAAVIRQ